MADIDASIWKIHDAEFHKLIGKSPTLELLLSVEEYPFAHEAGVFIPSRNELFITSNQFPGPGGEKKIQISKISLGRDGCGVPTHEEIRCDSICMANGGVNDIRGDDVLFCAQGSMTAPSGLFRMSSVPPYQAEAVLTSFYGRPFNSVNDVVFSSDGCIWFTDPIYGFEQGYRPPPSLPSQVYRFDPSTSSIRAVADGFKRPNGLCFSPDESVLYVTDTDYIHGDGSTDPSRASSM
ncbi:hypothetical protein SLS62_000177 [Diatrype stigma]|uniref:SMP-30/Gluconolactonase/LRE-like region domain-containing protein n=1 Tax=Diatrype stigma TaxID=117547 RepID=A0AAN9VAX3_9PEZI